MCCPVRGRRRRREPRGRSTSRPRPGGEGSSTPPRFDDLLPRGRRWRDACCLGHRLDWRPTARLTILEGAWGAPPTFPATASYFGYKYCTCSQGYYQILLAFPEHTTRAPA